MYQFFTDKFKFVKGPFYLSLDRRHRPLNASHFSCLWGVRNRHRDNNRNDNGHQNDSNSNCRHVHFCNVNSSLVWHVERFKQDWLIGREVRRVQHELESRGESSPTSVEHQTSPSSPPCSPKLQQKRTQNSLFTRLPNGDHADQPTTHIHKWDIFSTDIWWKLF